MVYRSAARVRPNDAAFFSISVPQNGSLAVQMHISTPSRTPTRPFSQPVMVVKQLNENGGIRLIKGPTVPSLYDWRFVDRSSVLGRLPMQTIVRGAVKRGQVMYIGVYNVPRMGWSVGLGKRLFVPGVVGVRIESFLCGQDGIVCPVGGAWEPGVGVLVLPLLMGVLTMLTMVVCVSVWAGVFRRQVDTIRTDERRDALTQTEVEAMFPPFEYTKRETVALGATGDVCCCVCLCGFEEGERLRRLACGHSYHAMCLDQWLVTNATCPRCRKAARISGELGGGWRTSIVGSLRRIVDRIGHLGGRDDPEGVGEELLATEEGRDDR